MASLTPNWRQMDNVTFFSHFEWSPPVWFNGVRQNPYGQTREEATVQDDTTTGLEQAVAVDETKLKAHVDEVVGSVNDLSHFQW